MSLYVIGDLHLSFGTDKPMDIFSGWTNYLERLEENWQNKVKPEDTVVIAGYVSWGMTMEEALEFIDDDELVEITPKSIRMRKRVLNAEMRKKLESRKKQG